MKRLLMLIFVTVFSCGVVYASPTFMGPTGLLNVPNADVLTGGSYNLFINHIGGDMDSTFYGGNIGIGDEIPLEAGMTIIDPGNGSETTLNTKLILPTQATELQIAVGVEDVTDEIARTWYVCFSREFAYRPKRGIIQPVTAVIGLGSNDTNAALDGLFLGVQTTLESGLELNLESDAEDLNFGVRYPVSEGLNLLGASVGGEFGFGAAYEVSY